MIDKSEVSPCVVRQVHKLELQSMHIILKSIICMYYIYTYKLLLARLVTLDIFVQCRHYIYEVSIDYLDMYEGRCVHAFFTFWSSS